MQRPTPSATRWQPRRTLIAALASLSLLVGISSASAQPAGFEALLPATTVAAFYLGPTAGDLSALETIWEQIGGDAAAATLMRVVTLLADDFTPIDDTELDPLGLLIDELSSECPAIADLWSEEQLAGLAGPSVLALSVSPFNPLPGAIAMVRPADAGYAATLQDALIDCLGSEVRFVQDDVTLHVLGDGSDLPVVVARFDGTFVAATDPDLLRAAVRLARGSDEPSHLDSAVGRAASTIMDGGIGISVDFAALADGVRPLTGMFPLDPDEAALIERALASVASLGGAAGRLTLDQHGVRYDGFVAADGSAGDAALAALFSCSTCAVSADPRFPAGGVSVSAMHVDLLGLVAWIDDLLGDIGAAFGESIDLRGLAAEVGLDLDALALGWIGSDWSSVQLAPVGTDLAGWLVGPGTITSVSVRDEAAAAAALGLWRSLLEGDDTVGAILEEILYEVMFLVDPFGPGPSNLGLAEGGVLSARTETYRGVGYERWRIGPTLDIGFIIHEGRLVSAMPARALRAYIDVAQGAAPGLSSDALFAPALSALPSGATAFAFSDTSRQLHAFADISDLLAAPLATLAGIAIEEALSDPWGAWDSGWDDWDEWGWDDDWGNQLSDLWRSPNRYGADLMNAAPYVQSLTVPGFMRGHITSNDVLPNGDYGLVFEVQSLIEGTTVVIEMTDPSRSWDMDTYLYLYDVGAGVIIADNDDAPDTNRSELRFIVEPGVTYAVVASSWGGNDTGEVILESYVSDWGDAADDPFVDEPVDDGAAPSDELMDDADTSEPLDVPSFAELVSAFDVVTDGLRALAERLGLASSVTVVEDGVRRTTWTLPLR